MPREVEPNVNNALGSLLQGMLSSSQVLSENTQVIEGQPQLQPDVLITAVDRSPVAIEAKYMDAAGVEQKARDRLGLEAVEGGRVIEAAIALRYPEEIGDAHDLQTTLKDASLSYCVFTVVAYDQNPRRQIQRVARFPVSGWLDGSVEDLADLLRMVSVPQLAVHNASTEMEAGIERVARTLDEMAESRPGIMVALAKLLGMNNVPQTRRMACAIIANAMVFHERIAGMHEGIKPLNLVCGPSVSDPQRETLAAWAEILKINYWPIFAVGRDIVEQLPASIARRILQSLHYTAAQVTAIGVNNSHDLAGRVFQRLIADRKYLATFYTLPASAALLARLAVAKMEGVDWSDAEAIGKLRIGDFACGTGALLSAVYEQLASRHERAGGDPAALHRVMMEEVLYGCDVMPSAVHITGSTLAGAQPSIGFYKSRIYSMPYGRLSGGSVAIGSLEFLNSNAQLTQANYTNPALQTGSAGEETAAQVMAEIRHGTFDIVIMNPPFTSNSTNEQMNIGTFAPAFAAFEASSQDQRDMVKRMSSLKKETTYHGHAGMASAFAALAHRKLKLGGIMALVLPLTAASSSSWQSFRQMMSQDYEDLAILSIATNGTDMSFSSDTGMAECLVIARKAANKSEGPLVERSASFTSLRCRPRGFAEAAAIANSIVGTESPRGIEDGPYGGTHLRLGDEIVGETLGAPDSGGTNWGSVRIMDYCLAQCAYALSQSKLWLPGCPTACDLKVSTLAEIGSLGLYNLDIIGKPPQGPFDKLEPSPTATYPSLWNHNAKKETHLICEPDSQLIVRSGMEAKAATVWGHAGRAHINQEFTFGSQALAAAFTELDAMGGRVWPNVNFKNTRFDYTFTLWCNSTLGLLSHWWHSSRQQSSKATIAVRKAESLPILDFRALSNAQLHRAKAIFEEFRDKEFKPAYLADADENRALLDRRVVCDLLGFDDEIYRGVRRLAAKWCAEPSVHGGKARPRDAGLVV